MRVKLLRDSRINHQAGEIVEVSPAAAGFLISVGSAEPVEPAAEKATKAVEAVAEKADKTPKAAPKTAGRRKTTNK